MVWWIAAGIDVLALLVLAVAVGLLLGRLRRVNQLRRRLTVTARYAADLQEPVLALQHTVESITEQVVAIQEKVEARAARKDAQD